MNQHAEAPDATTPKTPDPRGPWIHLGQLDALAAAVIGALPQRVRLQVCDQMDKLPAADYVRHHIEQSIDPGTPRRGEIDVIVEDQLTRFPNYEALNQHMLERYPETRPRQQPRQQPEQTETRAQHGTSSEQMMPSTRTDR